METYLFFLFILIILAISDLMVGVANDAVNFINSAVGSKVSTRKVILSFATVGILFGALFSSGMMEVARKGIFNPSMFTFPNLMIVFLAVMFVDVLFLDFYNTFGLPTSTTVSMVSSLFGASVFMSLIKIHEANSSIDNIVNYINVVKVTGIFSAIFLSVLISFTAGSIIQFLSRLIFTFNYEKRLKRYGAIWGSLALTSIVYFIFVKGIKGASFLSDDIIKWVLQNSIIVLTISFVFWALILEMVILFTNINILKPIVLIGTSSLALSFAANDLVNFIGVPLAGLSSYKLASNSTNPFTMTMEGLLEPAKTNPLLLLAAGLIMALTIWKSKKAQTVTRTEINLGRQFDGYEKFDSSPIARSIVRVSFLFGKKVKSIIPKKIYKKIDKRFDSDNVEYTGHNKKEKPAFDLIRATVNLMVSSCLISLGTAYTLPLSTTYVTFMVAMGTSFADRSWGRESAVYRVSGVITVIAGWVLTAFIAFLMAGILTLIFYYGKLAAVIGTSILTIYIFIRTALIHKEADKKIQKKELVFSGDGVALIPESILEDVMHCLNQTINIYEDIYSGLTNEKRKQLKKAIKESQELEEHSELVIRKLLNSIHYLENGYDEDIDFGKAISSFREISNSLIEISEISFNHVDNNHSGFVKEQKEDFKHLRNNLIDLINTATKKINKEDSRKIDDIEDNVKDIKKFIKKISKNQLSLLKNGTVKPRTNLLFLNLLFKTENIADNVLTIMNFSRFITESKKMIK
ncbi:inorganic phosphate transporter [Rosettibacter firmus]|uniref:inorganic phosphate transporter n=1 Tax=Rosettibacter firmus TaxID=3111522 RepID=UPI00336C0424